ncbi:MAG: hypothetical protein GXO28_02810 [Methanopyri archaeon]|nr:hypothetical protein [Methanopyri archaeon]
MEREEIVRYILAAVNEALYTTLGDERVVVMATIGRRLANVLMEAGIEDLRELLDALLGPSYELEETDTGWVIRVEDCPICPGTILAERGVPRECILPALLEEFLTAIGDYSEVKIEHENEEPCRCVLRVERLGTRR